MPPCPLYLKSQTKGTPMTYAFTDNAQIEEYIPTDEDWASYLEDDQALEEYSLECAFGPND